ncbi:MAG: RimK family protein [Lentisphaeria bacterium]|nr:RimK family protein [Lentisphaeria bacterium]
MRNVVVVSRKSLWPLDVEAVEVVTARSYLTDPAYAECDSMRVFNLCRSYKYQSTGYYVSLLAEARGHRAIPDVATILDLRSQTLTRAVAVEIDTLIQQALAPVSEASFLLRIYFGQTARRGYLELGRRLYNLFQAPLLSVRFVRAGKWMIQQIAPLPFSEVPSEDADLLLQLAQAYFSRKRFRRQRIQQYAYDMAILANPAEVSPPSNREALRRFRRAAEREGFCVETISREDYSRLSEFDALFIRETTSVNHYTYRFARRAFAEGLAVIDDPWSILRCSNKVFLAEMLARERIPAPRTAILQRGESLTRVLAHWTPGFPCVLKQPDSAFSRGVTRIETPEQLGKALQDLFRTSDLVIAQEFVRSDFDWRIGVLGRKPLFACKYFMANGHWQIYNWQAAAREQSGEAEALPIEAVPPAVLQAALRAANAVGDGFYGVDLKQIGNGALVIEINDNPSIDAGVEDACLGQALYDAIMRHFRMLIDSARNRQPVSPARLSGPAQSPRGGDGAAGRG